VIYVLKLYETDVSSGKNSIRNPGGYFRSMARLIKSGKIDLETELLVLLRDNLAQAVGLIGQNREDAMPLLLKFARMPIHP
jgi:hypothetical protein